MQINRAVAYEDLSRRAFGVAVLAFGVMDLVWPDSFDWLPLRSMWSPLAGHAFDVAVALAEIAGGAALLVRRTARVGGMLAGAAFFALAVLCIPHILATPRVYDAWGNFFEEFSLATGAAIVAARWTRAIPPATTRALGRICFGSCIVSFTLEQAIYLGATASLVPSWLPPGQTFWAIATTVPLGLAAVALLLDRLAWLAAVLLAAMLGLFGLIVWLPLLAADPHSHFKWSETIETFAIAGAAWILADLIRPAP